jgi:hypothetical protein
VEWDFGDIFDLISSWVKILGFQLNTLPWLSVGLNKAMTILILISKSRFKLIFGWQFVRLNVGQAERESKNFWSWALVNSALDNSGWALAELNSFKCALISNYLPKPNSNLYFFVLLPSKNLQKEFFHRVSIFFPSKTSTLIYDVVNVNENNKNELKKRKKIQVSYKFTCTHISCHI